MGTASHRRRRSVTKTAVHPAPRDAPAPRGRPPGAARFGTLAAAALFAVVAPGRATASAAVQPTHRIAVLVGHNLGQPGEVPLRYAEQEAERMAAVLQELGGVAPGWTYLERRPTAARLETVFREVQNRIQALGPRGRALLFFYFSGHAAKDGLHLGTETLSQPALRRFITKSGAHLSIAFVDACFSGEFARRKGLQPDRKVALDHLQATAQTEGHVIITSSGPEEFSQEADQIRGSYFSHYLMSGLRGAADSTGDNIITLSELYQFTYRHTLYRTMGTRAGAQHATRELKLTGTGDVPLAHLSRGRARITMAPGLRGQFLVWSKYGRTMHGELSLDGQAQSIALPANAYLVGQRTDDAWRVAEVNLAWGGEKTIGPDDFEERPFLDGRTRGPYAGRVDQLSLGLGLHAGPFAGDRPYPGVQLGYQQKRGGWVVGADLRFAQGAFDGVDTRVRHRGAFFSVLGGRSLSDELDGAPLSTYLGLRVGGGYVGQRIDPAPSRGAYLLESAIEASASVRIIEPWAIFLRPQGGAQAYETADGGWTLRPVVSLYLGIAHRF